MATLRTARIGLRRHSQAKPTPWMAF